mmetsp:Transcript_27434/g.39285  ORF Transcript_27434/g.39285 Transcript_27434/m.39285 type:complete len:175 (+) Transcript_27434:198-722(+)|eukprot:CAMPEP_0201689452 /NCGR_PEP_ID=MMETSP0578-20130828/3030_1 /ASSEMBLY_ACC=CAM_ASM_000663 /TAXON_ID=267565 /ORGANISM="Skeletonema grethea, Strain CCMP 1804" /LENGTH=174 /DNA_ID=CAMNT_0048174089 /DNA_START=140 /DNA_END=664 /DNA_ORIENTATION=-
MKIDHAEIKKRLMVFALSLIIIHRIILLAAKGTALTSRTCVETDDNVYFCTDDLEEARQKAKKTHRYYLNNYGVKQTIMGNTQDVATMRRLESEMGPYLKKIIEEHGGGEEWLKEQCTNQHKNCIFWAMKGECTSNPKYMEEHCALACKSCHKLKKETTEDETCSCSADQEQCM